MFLADSVRFPGAVGGVFVPGGEMGVGVWTSSGAKLFVLSANLASSLPDLMVANVPVGEMSDGGEVAP